MADADWVARVIAGASAIFTGASWWINYQRDARERRELQPIIDGEMKMFDRRTRYIRLKITNTRKNTIVLKTITTKAPQGAGVYAHDWPEFEVTRPVPAPHPAHLPLSSNLPPIPPGETAVYNGAFTVPDQFALPDGAELVLELDFDFMDGRPRQKPLTWRMRM